MKYIKGLLLSMLVCCQPVFANCWNKAGADYHVDPYLLLAIAKVESGMNPHAINWNHDGTYDVGLMQINSSHFSELASQGIEEATLIAKPCTSIRVGASILSKMINVYGNNWEAVGAYNAGVRKDRYSQRMHYARLVWNKYQQVKQASG